MERLEGWHFGIVAVSFLFATWLGSGTRLPLLWKRCDWEAMCRMLCKGMQALWSKIYNLECQKADQDGRDSQYKEKGRQNARTMRTTQMPTINWKIERSHKSYLSILSRKGRAPFDQSRRYVCAVHTKRLCCPRFADVSVLYAHLSVPTYTNSDQSNMLMGDSSKSYVA